MVVYRIVICFTFTVFEKIGVACFADVWAVFHNE